MIRVVVESLFKDFHFASLLCTHTDHHNTLCRYSSFKGYRLVRDARQPLLRLHSLDEIRIRLDGKIATPHVII
jgi:hypothetical protein